MQYCLKPHLIGYSAVTVYKHLTSFPRRISLTIPPCMQVLVDNPAELEKIRERESDITKERIQKVLDAGANVVLTTKGIDDMSLKYFVEAGVIACRRVPKEDLR